MFIFFSSSKVPPILSIKFYSNLTGNFDSATQQSIQIAVKMISKRNNFPKDNYRFDSIYSTNLRSLSIYQNVL